MSGQGPGSRTYPMAVLFVLGAMSLFWMKVVAVVIFAEKVLPRTAVLALALVALGSWSPCRRRTSPD